MVFPEFFSPEYKTLFPASVPLCLKLNVLFSYLPTLVLPLKYLLEFVRNNRVKLRMNFVHNYHLCFLSRSLTQIQIKVASL